ncbi:MAG TPA: CRISPR-associated ring nuclease Csm6 [Candidatus Sulfotelmatobacter sp.]|nr:CRISPR-associated ring nuclease Csm6 [Candidatus Sulfotelmatobacter sp.]
MRSSKAVLVAVLGNTPAILTEAFYFYAKRGIVFSRVECFTTSEGRKLAQATLLGAKNGAFRRLLTTLRLRRNDVAFDASSIHVLSAGGNALRDAADADELFTMADDMYRHMRSLFRPDESVYATIAGGRKSVGACLSMVFQLFARPQRDCLFHVVADSALERDPKFFFPGDPAWRKKPVSDDLIKCTEIPVLYWPWSEAKRPETFRELWEQRQRELLILADPPQLVINRKKHAGRIGNAEFVMEPVECFHYCLIADLRKSGRDALRFADIRDDLEFVREGQIARPTFNGKAGQEFLQHYERVFREVFSGRAYQERFADRLSQDFLGVNAGRTTGGDPALRTSISNIRKTILKALKVSPEVASVYFIENIGRRNDARYFLRLDPEKIIFE